MIDLLPTGLPAFKANLHAHSTFSDGALTPGELKAFYLSQGISVVAFTDHEMLHNHSELTEPGVFTALTGYELGFNDVLRLDKHGLPIVHLNLLARRPDLLTHVNFRPEWCWASSRAHREAARSNGIVRGRFADAATLNATIADAREAGFLVTLNHPAWSLIPESLLTTLTGLWGFEIYNTSAHINGGSNDCGQLYDTALRTQPHLCCIAADDTHLKAPCGHPRCDRGRGWVTFFAPDIEYASVIAALEQAHFYASNGPEITSLRIDGTFLRITCSPVRSIYLRSSDRRVSSVLASPSGPLITEAALRIKNAMSGPLRLILTDEQGRQAWTNPIPWPYPAAAEPLPA